MLGQRSAPLTKLASLKVVWETFHRGHNELVQELRAFRFNVNRGLHDIELDEMKSSPAMRAATDQYLAVEKVLGEIEACSQNLA